MVDLLEDTTRRRCEEIGATPYLFTDSKDSTVMAMQGSLFQSPPRDTSLRVGPAGWNYKDWEGIVYPSSSGRSFDPLAFLAEYFDAIEINSSFYRPPRPDDAASWARRVRNNPRFKFTAKAWQRLSHEITKEAQPTLVADCNEVRRSLAPLMEAGVLGAVLVQFPWSFKNTPENADHLEKLFRRLHSFPLALEVRHGSWSSEAFYALLRENRVSFCNIDQPVIGDSLRLSAHVTARIGYFRLHGRNYQNWFNEDAGRDARYDYLYSKEEIRQVGRQIHRARQTAEETYVITNNHFRGQALVNALDILEEMDVNPPAIPPMLAAAYPDRLACP
ncbi:MAG TPA: DUF72 domain-containing protein [Acidobacteriota bacterium]|nr:DUF72 domain-containing protein [Acidobacteriota bacterium]